MIKVDQLLQSETEDSLQSIEVPQSLYSFVEKVPGIVNQKEKINTLKPVNKRWKRQLLSWGAAAAITVFAIGITSNVTANFFENVPFLKLEKNEGFKENFSSLLNAAKNDQFTSIGQTVEDNGVKMVITDAIYDGSLVALSFSFETSDNLEVEDITSSKMQMFFNGEKESWSSVQDFSKINQNKYAGVMKIWVPDKKINDKKLNLDLTFSKVLGTTGKWNFALDLDNAGQIFATNSSIQLNDADLRITNVTFTPLKTEITVTGDDFNNVIMNILTPEGTTLSIQDSFESEKIKRFQYQPINTVPQSIQLKITKGTDTKTVVLSLKK